MYCLNQKIVLSTNYFEEKIALTTKLAEKSFKL